MKIGLLHFRVGETDGVSLEMEKWKIALERLGHKVNYIAGTLGSVKGFKVPLLAYNEPMNLEIKKLSFENLSSISFSDLKNKILKLKDEIKLQLNDLEHFDLIIANNIWSLGYNLSAAIALYEYCKESNTKMLGHHHDFYFERDYYSNPATDYVKGLLEIYFPPKDIRHVTINSLAQSSLKTFKGIDSTVVPNVFDFKQNLWKKDSYNSLITKILGIKPNDMVFLQATRIVKRKAIEMAIDVLSKINTIKFNYYGKKTATNKLINENSDIILVLPGLDEEPSYKNKIIEHAKKKEVKLIFASHICESERSKERKTFSLWDFYSVADFVTYPSVKEGFGNQFLEAVFAKKPIMVFEYPVYGKDIKKVGFEVVSLGNKAFLNDGLFEVSNRIQESSANRIMDILVDKDRYFSIVDNNFALGEKNYSYEILTKILYDVIKNIK